MGGHAVHSNSQVVNKLASDITGIIRAEGYLTIAANKKSTGDVDGGTGQNLETYCIRCHRRNIRGGQQAPLVSGTAPYSNSQLGNSVLEVFKNNQMPALFEAVVWRGGYYQRPRRVDARRHGVGLAFLADEGIEVWPLHSTRDTYLNIPRQNHSIFQGG